MRHNVVTKTFSRDTEHRKAMMRNLASSLVTSGSITTTLAKAKYLRPYIEKILTKAKKADLSAIRSSVRSLGSEVSARKLISEIAPKFLNRAGGYTRIIKLGLRDGDKAPLAKIEFVAEEQKPAVAEKKTTRVKKTKPEVQVVEEVKETND